MVPDVNIVLGGSGVDRTVTVTPALGQNGSAVITVTVDDGTDSAFTTFVVNVYVPPGPPGGVISGSYVGDGTDNRSISGVGFEPAVLIVKGDTTEGAVIRTFTMPAGMSKDLAATTALAANRIQALLSDGFELGDDASVNAAGVNYYWTAYGSGDNRMKAGSYTGRNGKVKITGLGYSPELVVVASASTHEPVFRASVDSNSYDFLGSAGSNAHITSLDADGFTLDKNSAVVNTKDVTYHYVAWNELAGQTAMGSYTGDGTDDRNFAGVGFQPQSLMVRGLANNYPALHHPDSIGAATDRSLRFDNTSGAANWVQRLQGDGFQIGSDNLVNQSGGPTYAYFAWGRQTPPTISTVVDQGTNEDTATPALAFTVGDGETAAASLTLSGSSSNQALVPDANIVFGGSGANRTVAVIPAANQFGSVVITVFVSDGTDEAATSFVLTVAPVADTPSVTNTTTPESTQTTSGLVISRNAADGPEVTHFKITGITNGTLYKNDGTTAITNGTFITFAEGNAGLKFTPTPGFNGTASFTIQASTSGGDPGLGGSTVNASITVTAVAPTVTDVTSSTANGTYKLGDPISIQVTFSEAVTVTDTPQLTLETGASDAVVDYTSGSGTATLTFSYTVAAGHTAADLDYISTAALALNGGTIRDAASNDATLTLATPGAAGSLGFNKARVAGGSSERVAGGRSEYRDERRRDAF